MSTHACPIAGCTVTISRHFLMCGRHWRLVPAPLQAAIRETYEAGKVAAYRSNVDQAHAAIAAAEGGRQAFGVAADTKALTIYQPWATLIIIGAKPFEFRKWNFADKPHLAKRIGQRVIIHASARPVKREELLDILRRIDDGESALRTDLARPYIEALLSGILDKTPMAMPLSAGLGSAVLGEPVSAAKMFADKVADSDRLDQHMYAWPMIDPRPFPAPVPAKGAQGFWNWS